MDAKILDAVVARKEDILGQAETLTLKKCRRMLEEDMGLAPKALDDDSSKDRVKVVMDLLLDGRLDELIARERKAPERRKAVLASSESDSDEDFAEEVKKIAKAKKKDDKKEVKPEKKEKKEKKKEKKKAKAAPPSKEAKAEPIQSTRVDKMKRMLRAATIRVSPNVWANNRDEGSLYRALLELLEKEGLGSSSSSSELESVKKRLELARDTEGVDASNIVSGRRRRTPVYEANVYAQMAGKGSDSDSEEEEEDDHDDDASVDEDGDKENKNKRKSPAGKPKSKKKKVEEEEEEEEEEESGSEYGGSDSEMEAEEGKAATPGSAKKDTPGSSKKEGKAATPGSAKKGTPGSSKKEGKAATPGSSGGKRAREAGGVGGGGGARRKVVIDDSDDDF